MIIDFNVTEIIYRIPTGFDYWGKYILYKHLTTTELLLAGLLSIGAIYL